MDNQDNGFNEFAAAFGGDDGNQTDTVEETVEAADEVETGEEVTEEAEDTAEGTETAEEDDAEEADKDGAEAEPEAGEDAQEQKFTIKVNKETREVNLLEMTELAQKGADYDRVKGQLDTVRQNEQTLQAKIDQQKPFMEFLELAAEQTGTTTETLVENLHVNLLKGKGMTEAEARAEIRAAKAEKQVKDLTAAKAPQDNSAEADNGMSRAQQEISDFAKAFPDVRLTDELVKKLMPDVHNGMSLTSAYLKMENARQAAEIAELQRKQAAAEQNKRNRARSPGSQQSSGGKTAKSDFDEFAEAFK